MKQILIIILLFLSVSACKKKKDPQPSLAPDKAVLVSPAANEACTEGTVLSATTSSVTLKWNASANTESYEVHIKNLLSGAMITQTTTATQLSVTLASNTPYSWFVISKSAASTAVGTSDIWKFYSAGQVTASYAPFPPDNLVPAMRQAVTAVNGKINLSWSAEDADNDLAGYDVFLGTNSTTIPLLQANIATKKLDDVSVTANTTYYWKVVAKDAKGNTSESAVYILKVN